MKDGNHYKVAIQQIEVIEKDLLPEAKKALSKSSKKDK
jgi:hypothetical protein